MVWTMEGTGSSRGSTATTSAVKHFPSTPRIAQPSHYQTIPASTPLAQTSPYRSAAAETVCQVGLSDRDTN